MKTITREPTRKPSAQTLETRSAILKAALKLFNGSGFFAVTTHDIAAAAGISPGNLYYHFENKEEIVREIFGSMEIFDEHAWMDRRDGFLDFMRFFFGNLHKYKFFFRDFGAILRAVPAMEKLWQLRFQALRKTMRQAAARWVDMGILKKFSSQAELDCFIDTVFILMNFSAVHYELGHADSAKSLAAKEINTVLRFLQPYHTPKGQAALQLYMEREI